VRELFSVESTLDLGVGKGGLVKKIKVYNVTRQCPLVVRGEGATSFCTRVKGLLGHPPLEPGQGMLIKPCQGVHTFMMRFPIDVVYVNGKGRVVHLTPYLTPNHVGPIVGEADFVIELPSGTITHTQTKVGDKLEILEIHP
jgi:uncharacterized membrane protein (UPF0127 family)